MIVDAIRTVVERRDLSRDEAFAVMDAIMSGRATDAQIAAFLTALRMKGETVEELIGFARVMREKVSAVKTRQRVQTSLSGTDREMLVDTCGTGGDATGTFNVSTATAFVTAGAGIPVAKHGNRSVSSLCGSADVVEALGVRLDLSPERVGKCIDETGIGFCYAPLLHRAMKFVMLARKEIRIRTVFNILGPLTNPAHAQAQVLGVAESSLAEKMAAVLRMLGCRHALVVHGEDGLDEITISGQTHVRELDGEDIRTYTISPEDFGFSRAELDGIRGSSAADNASLVRALLAGAKGPRRDVVLMNAAAAIVAGGRARSLPEGAKLAAEAIDSGRALEKLDRLVRVSQGMA